MAMAGLWWIMKIMRCTGLPSNPLQPTSQYKVLEITSLLVLPHFQSHVRQHLDTGCAVDSSVSIVGSIKKTNIICRRFLPVFPEKSSRKTVRSSHLVTRKIWVSMFSASFPFFSCHEKRRFPVRSSHQIDIMKPLRPGPWAASRWPAWSSPERFQAIDSAGNTSPWGSVDHWKPKKTRERKNSSSCPQNHNS